jgi:CubicO group peptidase (beta-lactamase class C family)
MDAPASISRPITATALIVLRRRGAISLDRPINQQLGEADLRASVGDAHEAAIRRATHLFGMKVDRSHG